MLTDVGLFSHTVAALGFGALAVVLLTRRAQSGTSLWLIAASLVTMVWALVVVLAERRGGGWQLLASPAETLRSAAWIAFLLAVLRRSWRLDERRRSTFLIASLLGFVVALQLLLDIVWALGVVPIANQPLLASTLVISRMAMAIAGLVMLHNLFVNADPESQGEVRLLCIGLAGVFAYDLNYYTLIFLFGTPSVDLYNIRGAVDVIVVPLLLVSSNQNWASRVHVSRQVVFHSLSFSMIGVYLIAMATAAYGLRLVGGDWGRLLQITFLFAMVLLAVVVLVSPRFRAWLRVLIAKNFFAYKYDYRQEWLRFISTVAGAGAGLGSLSERVIRGVCTVVDSPGGVLFTLDGEGNYAVAATWRFDGFTAAPLSADGALPGFLANRQRIIDLDELRAGSGDYGAVRLPPWAATDTRAWLIVPLTHLERLEGFLLIERTLVARALNWEDFDLLRTLGRQAASYIAEAASQEALDEAGKFDEFNRRFAFIMHDLKNLVSQLSLVARNAERHSDNPAFRADMVATLQSSVGKMNDLLARLSQREISKGDGVTVLDVDKLVAEVVAAKKPGYPQLELTPSGKPVEVSGDGAQLEQMFAHLIQNAIDASVDATAVTVSVASGADEVAIAVADQGVGMTPAFLRNDLFRPFHSTKPGGFGIGAYEARTIVRNMGGQLDVASTPGEGTVFTVRLPIHHAVGRIAS
ncbi:XrtA/PEP-CTERM system histidine kinase PrsK [Polymorphobacter arshaanensis]|uniref:XrtA/PEP-CTERM system histidine kinase PrsK n=1 Tax=Glacieibacterium arshaanense TaxID=2511025 RepID=UPI00140D803D|nr:XrtA/PEP-CTERM system histidine kinase PrsK [Polymorphobacter arshaanensis]